MKDNYFPIIKIVSGYKTIKLFKVDAFASELFKGNQAAVIQLNEWLSDDEMLSLSKENGIPETAYFIKKDDHFLLRWFTPEIEIDLCGHATLATSHVIFSNGLNTENRIEFQTKSGELVVQEIEKGKYAMNFPSRKPERDSLPDVISESLNIQPISVYKSRDYILLYENESQIIEATSTLPQTRAYGADITDEKQVETLFTRIVSEIGRQCHQSIQRDQTHLLMWTSNVH